MLAKSDEKVSKRRVFLLQNDHTVWLLHALSGSTNFSGNLEPRDAREAFENIPGKPRYSLIMQSDSVKPQRM